MTVHSISDAEPMYAIDGVGFKIRDCSLLEPLSLHLPKHRVHGLIGHNGSGKSTLFKPLARQLAPSSGSLRFGGRVLARCTPQEMICSNMLADIYGIPVGMVAHPCGGAPIGFAH